MAQEIDLLVPTIDKPQNIKSRLLKIHQLEQEGDDIYQAATAELFRADNDVREVIILKELYDNLEAAIDRCQHTGDLVERIVIKNT